ncbi:PAAR domain-containing protein [Acinetobacter rongchengensis]|uniref:PAAR domain-containing protein n=1 Tax=Acinetobacter rongchengensis TaxID=2419601 RepID=A0A3A8F1A9_9GAMM|nr:PAAR domain-containing protein [Acinetobacter rongchengensis]RKG36810.1 PAAR domain-containing protein [Acinetobacter rongchengensis]
MKAFITVGCKTDHGGIIILGDSSFIIEGKAVHLDGMTHYCPKCQVQSKAIASNQGFMTVNGKSIVVANDTSTCGAKFIKISDLVVMDRGTGNSSSNSQIASLTNNFISKPNQTYDEQIQLENINGEPYTNVEYIVTFEDGSTHKGITDNEGNTERLKTKEVLKVVTIDILIDSSCNESCSCGA